MPSVEKIWSEEAYMKYPKQWIVFVEMECDPETHKHMGIVHLVTSDKDEAYETELALGRSMGNSVVMEGFNDTPQIGGLSLWGR
ncbi:MAG: hypothetical protein FWB96_02045 [Defluviitaleaceae bacterium]|nr:hypothetical protein [Defluviitaleaceae bacterium]MCL2262008.1 hypothetical protein [Defluviitaleaceae bacterium]